MDSLSVIVDSREKNIKLIEALEARGFVISTLNAYVGDYILSKRVCIERKSLSDFDNSVINGRLFEQLNRLKASYEMPLLLIEGRDVERRLESRAIVGAIASVYLRYGIPFLFSSDEDESADIMYVIAKQEQSGNDSAPSLKGGRRLYELKDYQEYVVGNLPGVGPKLAMNLLKHFGSIKSIANSSIDELMEVDKIGKRKAGKIHDTLNGDYHQSESLSDAIL